MHFRHNIWHGVMLGECPAVVIVRVGSVKRNSSPCSGGAPQSSLQSSPTLMYTHITWGDLVEVQIPIQDVGKGPESLHF